MPTATKPAAPIWASNEVDAATTDDVSLIAVPAHWR